MAVFNYVPSTAVRWGFVKVLYNDSLYVSDRAMARGILAYGGGTYWARTFDTLADAGQVNDPYDEYDDGETLEDQFQFALAAGQEPIFYANCLVPTSLRAAGATPGWPGTSIDAAPDQTNHQIVADYYAAVVDHYYDLGLRTVIVGGEFRGMYSSDPGATPALPDGWDVPRYWDLYEKIYDAIKALRPSVQVYGPYMVFYDGTPYSEPNTTLGVSTVVATEALDGMSEFLDFALAAEKLDGVVFDGVIPTAGWPDLLDWVKLQIGDLPMFVAELYDSYTAPPTGPIGDEITTELLATVDAELRPGDRAMVWCEPDFWALAPLAYPDSTVTDINYRGLRIDSQFVSVRNYPTYFTLATDFPSFTVSFGGRPLVSAVDVCNMALGLIGNKAKVTAISPVDGSAESTHCARYYPIALRSLLEMHNWSFAQRKIELTVVNADPDDTDDPAWCYRYQIPDDWVKTISILADEAEDNYLIAGVKQPQDCEIKYSETDEEQRLYTDTEDAWLRYTFYEDDPNQWSQLFIQALAWHLAAMLAGPIIKGAEGHTEAQRCLQRMGQYLAEAKGKDSNERQATLTRKASWIAGR